MEEFAYWLPGPKTADDETVPVGMDHIHIVCIRLVQPNFGGVALKKGVQQGQGLLGYFPIIFSTKSSVTCDSAEVSQLLPNEARHMSTKGEPNQMGVVVDVPKLQVDGLDEQGHLVVK